MKAIKITASEYKRSSESGSTGLSIQLSPIDIPREIVSRFDKETGILHIDFQYSDNEECISKSFNDKVNTKVGKHSGKILGFEIKVAKYDIGELAVTIETAVEKELPRLAKFNERENYKIINSLVRQFKEPIFADLAHA
jgi:hypothetical protein